MFQFLRTSVQYIAPVFVICTMLNVGLTQKPSAIAGHLKNWPFVLKMLAANFIFAPLVMIGTLYLVPFDPALKAGLMIFCLGAGAPFLIKLTQTAEHDLALGAAVMMVLMVVTVPYVPLVLPLVLSGVSVNALAIARALLLQMLLPIGIGMLAAALLPGLSKKLQPLVGGLGNIAMYAMVVATLVGYFPNLLQIIGTGAFLVGLLFVRRLSASDILRDLERTSLKMSVGSALPNAIPRRALLSPSRTSATQTCSLCSRSPTSWGS
jgi:BASS family bile acid:Na+ symporter